MMHILLALGALLFTTAASAIEHGQIDTFDDGTTAGWVKGAGTQLPVQNIADGGPEGAGDNYIRITSTGVGNADSRQIFYNQAQWTGDYNAANVGAITMMVNNFGATTLYLRIAIQGPSVTSVTQFCSTVPFVLPAASGWTHAEFDLTAPSMSLVSGTSTLEAVLGNVNTVRILSAESGPDWRGDIVASTLGVDQILARSTIIPVVESTWGRVKETFVEP